MQHSQRLDQKLHMLREEVRTMTQEKERGERVWRERLQRCQKQLKAKEEEMSRQSQYFENFKTQLQHKLSLTRDREQNLQNRIYNLEKQLLEMTVSAATGMATIRAARITAGTVTHFEEQDRLPSMRGEGEGEEEKKEERRKQWQREGDEEKAATDGEGGRNKVTKQTSNEARLQGFIICLQEDLRVLLEREEDGMTERRGLMEQLQEAQGNSHLLGCKVEELKGEVHQLKLSESFLMEEVEELREENERLQKILRDAANQTPSQSSTIPDSTCMSPGTNSPRCSPAVCPTSSDTLFYTTAMGQSSVGSSGEVQSSADVEEVLPHLLAVSLVDHQGAAECLQNNTVDCVPSAKSKTPPKHEPLNLFHHFGSKSDAEFQPLSFITESLNEFKLGNMEESPSEESDALRKAFRSLGLGEDLRALQEQCEQLEVALQHKQDQLKVMAKENAQLRSQLRNEAEEQQKVTEHWSSREKIVTPPTYDGDDRPPSSPAQEEAIITVAQDDLVQALNQENRALADRIQELMSRTELREEAVEKEQTKLRGNIFRLKEDGIRLEQENHEQGCLILELTKKTEDDLNTIMELQEKLEELKAAKEESQGQKAGIPEIFLHNDQEECADSVVASVLKEDAQISQITTASLSGCNKKNDSLHNNSQSIMHVSSLTDQVAKLNNSIQSLKTEEEELIYSINSLREQQRDVALSVQTQTDEKQLLTRTVWALKEQKDCISQSLAGLKQEKEQLSRAVSGLKNERDQFISSMSGLKEEKEQLTKSFSALQRDKEAIIKSLSSGREERDQIMQSLQGLQAESNQLSQTVLHLKQQRDKLTDSRKCLTEQRDQEQLANTSKEDHDRLIKAVRGLKEEKGQIEHSVGCLRQEEKQIMQIILGLREEKTSPQAPSIQTQTDERDHERQLMKLREELDKSHVESKRLHSELSQSEVKRKEADIKVAQTAEQIVRLTDAASKVEDVRTENSSLAAQVNELQSKLTDLLREKINALSLKTQIERQCNILTAELKAKTVALEELNSEYIALKRGQGSRDDRSTALVSLRARYNDIRAKYDALLKRKSLKDLDVAPLKAKLSCLVVKCQERNSLLAQTMKAMHRRGCADAQLTQQVERLLRDAALQDYTAAFAPGSRIQARGHCDGFTQEFIATFQDHTNGFIADQTCPAALTSVSKQQNGVSPESGDPCVTPLAKGTLKKNPPGPTSPVDEQRSVLKSAVLPLKCSLITNSSQLSSTGGPVQATSRPEKPEFHDLDVKEKSSSDPTSSSESSQSPSPPSFNTRVSPSRRLSSPEKILNLHEQLQKTLMSGFQAPENRGRGRQPGKSLSLSAPADLSSPKAKKKNLTCSFPHTPSLPVATDLSPAEDVPLVTTKSASFNKSGTLFNAVASRSANAALSPCMFTNRHLKGDMSKTSALSSSSNFPLVTVAPSKDESISNDGPNVTTSPNQTKETAISDIFDAKHTASAFLKTATFNPSVTNPKSTCPGLSASGTPTVPMFHILNNASKTNDPFSPSCTQSAHSSDKRSNKSAREFTAAHEKASRPKPEAPAEVRSVEVIKTVGQSSLLIGWERPLLDELGCSNGTFVYGYRVCVDGDFHKSVMSSACTKCILENVDLSVPVGISVQTLGSNGLCSNSVNTVFRTSNRTEQY
ncbi:uncharacterized protein jakmip1 isoform X1 [Leuresthes tenuis]|uniref:uncharacterized protein jakmip1 isoform X1 n=1 Tax=Leuresthes tenuis TaxID=355514 RepID=UPI003B507CB5